jgi:hypothetical protein
MVFHAVLEETRISSTKCRTLSLSLLVTVSRAVQTSSVRTSSVRTFITDFLCLPLFNSLVSLDGAMRTRSFDGRDFP